MKENSLTEIPYGPANAIEMSSGNYTAVIVPHIGANLISLRDDSRGLDILRTPPSYEELRSNSVVYGIPLLFFPNRITGGRIKRDGFDIRLPINDPTGTMHIHGFLHSRPWKVEKCLCGQECTVKCVFRNNSDSDFYEYFPFDFRASLTYRLSGDGLNQVFEMVNTGKGPMPFGFGYHIAFRVPFSSDGSTETCSFRVSAGARWEVGENVIPTGRFIEDESIRDILNNKGLRANGEKMSKMCFKAEPFNIDASFSSSIGKASAGSSGSAGSIRPFNGAILSDTGCENRIIFETDKGFGHWLIWNGEGNSSFICIEPQTWMTNAPNLDLDSSLSGYRILEPGSSVKLANRIYTVK